MASGGSDQYLVGYIEGWTWRAIAAKGLDANDFELAASELRGYKWKLSHMPTGEALHASRSFTGVTDERADLLRTRPDDDPVAYERAGVMSYLEMVKAWADELKAARPGWQRPGGGATTIGSAGSQAGENRAFTLAEQAEITNQLRAIRDSVRKNYKLTAEQLTAIDTRLEEAEEASKRLGRKDWKSLFYGIVFGLIVNDAIPPDVAQHIFTGVLHGLAHLLGAGAPLGPWLLGQ